MGYYVSKLSIHQKVEEYYDLEKLFSVVREKIEGNSFTYAPVDKKHFLIMQSAKSELGYSAKGIFGNLSDLCDKAPAAYIEGITNIPIYNDDRPLAPFSFPRTDADSFSKARNLHHIFGKLFDAIVFTNKPIIILTEDHASAINYIKTLNLILPAPLMKNVGFSVGMDSIPDNSIEIIKNSGEEFSLAIRVWVIESDDFSAEYYSSSYFIFDTRNNSDNFASILSITGEVLGDINLLDSCAENYIRDIQRAFDSNGAVNLQQLEQSSVLYLFDLKPQIDSAKQILLTATTNDSIPDRYIVNAIQTVLNENSSIDTELENLIYGRFLTSESIIKALSNYLYNYFKLKFPDLNRNQLGCFNRIIVADTSGGMLNDLLSFSCAGDFKNMVKAFGLAANILHIKMNSTRIGIKENLANIRGMVENFAIDSCYRKIPMQEVNDGEEFFLEITKFTNFEFSYILISVLLASAYKKGTPVELCDTRIKGLKRYISNIGMSGLNIIELLLAIRNNLYEIANEIPNLNIDESTDFIFNTENGEHWIRSVIDGLPAADLLTADTLVRSRVSGGGIFDSLAAAIRSKLLDINFVNVNLKSGDPLFERYAEFFRSIESDRRPSDISAYLGQLDSEMRISEQFAKYRYDFTTECVRTLSQTDRKQLIAVNSDIPSYDSLDEHKRIGLVEKTIEVFGTISTGPIGGRKKKYKGILIWASLFSFLSMLILSLPSIIIPIGIGAFDIAHIKEKFLYFFIPEFFAIPLIIFGLKILLSLIIKKGNQVKRANIIVFICGILPVFCMVVSYIVCYFINVPTFLNIGG